MKVKVRSWQMIKTKRTNAILVPEKGFTTGKANAGINQRHKIIEPRHVETH